ncbi:MAG: helix-turn-helix, type 11 protein [uncultured bacterium]|nr:MAG: helix-turn-helix, type 11 protein [uncultured bacterium]
MKNKILQLIKESKIVKSSILTKKLKVSRQYLNRIVNQLLEEKRIIKFGITHNAEYVLFSKENLKKLQNNQNIFKKRILNKNLHEHQVFIDLEQNIIHLANLSRNVRVIIEYAFTEMLNNAIDHSKSKFVTVNANLVDDKFSFEIADQGVGIFNNIKIKKKLKNEMQAVEDLFKGKQTTMPQRHSGEGIFFTSKVADKLIIESSDIGLIFDNNINDIFITKIARHQGTKVRFEIDQTSKTQLNQIFKKYTDNNFSFNKSEIKVKLFQHGTSFLSRSRAKRVMSGLDKFNTIILDFDQVETIGQGFADEVFRVWQSQYSGITIVYTKTNKNVEFMIKRALV